MKKIILIVLFFGVIKLVMGQNQFIDSLRNQLTIANTDSAKVKGLGSLADYYAFVQFDSSVFMLHKRLTLLTDLTMNPENLMVCDVCSLHPIARAIIPKPLNML